MVLEEARRTLTITRNTLEVLFKRKGLIVSSLKWHDV
jgi:hypothetical protein